MLVNIVNFSTKLTGVYKTLEIKYLNRENKQIEVEKVYGDKWIQWLYGNGLGPFFSTILSKKPISIIYGKIQDSKILSQGKISPFVENFNINLSDYLPEDGQNPKGKGLGYKNFNQFFIRKFRPEKRPFPTDPSILPAFCEARYFAWDKIENEMSIPVKGKYLQSLDLLGNESWAKTFEEGPLVIARLCPVDYHRFHFPDNGEILDHYRLSGHLHSVNPIALKKNPDIFITNERHVTILDTKNFGKMAYIEVGATMVGKIIQNYEGKNFKKGQEKGYFLFGGSTVVLIGEKGKWTPDKDIVESSKKGMEVYLKLGNSLGHTTV